MAKVSTTEQLKRLAQQMKAQADGKADNATTLEGYGIKNAYTKEQIDGKLSSTYKPGGSAAFASLPAADAAHLGMVYNMTDAFTTTDSFLEGAGKHYPAGPNVVIVTVDGGFKYDALSGFVDLSGYVKKESGKGLSTNDFTNRDKEKLDGIEVATDSEFDSIINEVFGAQ